MTAEFKKTKQTLREVFYILEKMGRVQLLPALAPRSKFYTHCNNWKLLEKKQMNIVELFMSNVSLQEKSK